MLRSTTLRAARGLLRRNVGLQAGTPATKIASVGTLKSISAIRHISNEPTKTFTRLSNASDKQRDQIFNYTWGSWLKNDKLEKERRTTQFSIEGLSKVINNLYIESKEISKLDPKTLGSIKAHKDSTVTLPNNVNIKNLDVLNANEKQVQLKTISSFHEGKHHRIYKIDTNLPGKSLVLRIPYNIDPSKTISNRIKSEVATMNFVATKCGIKTPTVYMYSENSANPVGTPFILEEFIDGELLMKQWDPLCDDGTNSKPPEQLKKVIDIVADFHSKLNSIQFNTVGSLYFKEDVDSKILNDKNTEIIDNKWVVGPVMERSFWRKKNGLNGEIDTYLGPWNEKGGSISSIIKNLGSIEHENAKGRASLIDANSSSEIAKKDVINDQISTFDRLTKIAPYLFNLSLKDNKTVPNLEDLLKSSIYDPDLDPMNIIVSKTDGTPYLLDFEGSVVKPFILQSSPRFVEYDGPKIYNIKDEIPDFDKLSENEKVQCQFIYKRTRNQYLWENALNERNPNLIVSMAPPIKLLRSPYAAANERKTDQDYLLIDENLLQLKQIWSELFKNKLVSEEKFPLEYTEEEIKKHVEDLAKLQEKLVTTPFAATQGWIPQDMFDNLVKSGLLIQESNGDYSFKPVLTPEPTESDKGTPSENK
ncbi:similar to Saccharomyces cerevisiae YER080W AIM9 Putative protein of unknown function [Maudiozyma barnettii]|uniref:Altered inheritance of mitochondria protein 9, mitochondrial n=1 Tax=Maudiozyma barnettii TaxID=61262 RepID=A0A8H2VEB3_9SACH|nr:Aim9p [Kazachstania barnettii]CAB4254000.1 similar to Saccharomyces cerevisiae YER080W AIM9 Putative protein of unknown function [Kazachstania barnettii]CAD1781750.1 similar to Saccharomyces cerevisiae YER080W AIM9 Putative protein of unknown function [Kazachstania barnettii]